MHLSPFPNRSTFFLIRLSLFITIFLLTLSLSACSNIAFQPSKKRFYEPKQFSLEYKDVYFKSKDGTLLHGWFFPSAATTENLGTIIQFHGNAENISTHFMSLAWIIEEGYNLFIFDYRGYGRSQGSPSHAGVNKDALAALEHAIKISRNQNSKLIAYGQSIGGAILLRALNDLEDKSHIDAVVIDSSFSSYQEIAREKLSISCLTWPFQPLAYLLMSDKFAPEEVIEKISPTPLLVIHGDNDRIIPIRHGKKIFDLAGEPKWFWQVKGGRHINAMAIEKGVYRKRLLNFFSTL